MTTVDSENRPEATDSGTDIAIVGMSGTFPGAPDTAQLWARIRAGQSGLTRFTDAELRAAGVSEEQLADPDYVKAGAVLDGIDLFDAAFFGFGPKEAQLLDPQHRLYLEHNWLALEDAGCDPARFGGSVGVFGGCGFSSYLSSNLIPSGVAAELGDFVVGLANDKDSLATRVAHTLGLTGPAYGVQSYCSTSLVAVCAAASSLANFECDLALAGGVAVAVPQRVGYQFQPGGITPPDGECRAFDAVGQGSPIGSGAGVVALRRLEDALADGDRVYAVIRGWAVNNDGGRKAGFTAPSVQGQAAVIAEALSSAGLGPADIDYVEAHGTGTALGDAVEIAALQQVFKGEALLIGSVKTNLGHLDRAAGVTGLIKAALALHHAEIPPTRNLTDPNRQLRVGEARLEVVTAVTPWPRRDGRVRRGGVSAFGIGGTNAHVVLEEAPLFPRADPAPRPELLLWSARSAAAADEMTGRLAAHLSADLAAESPADALCDVAYTLQTGRRVFEHRRMLVAASRDEAARALREGRAQAQREPRTDRTAAFLIAGAGEQYPGMAAELYRTEPAFAAVLDECRTILTGLLDGTDPLTELLESPTGTSHRTPGASQPDAPDGLAALLGRGGPAAGASPGTATRLLHPALFAVEYALARLFMSWGVEPSLLAGYSLGEYVVACLSGVLTLDSALRLVTERARLIDALPGGGMAAVPLPEAELRQRIERARLDGLDIAAVNGSRLTVVAGERSALAALAAALEPDGVPLRPLATTHAFHSRMLAPARTPLTEWIRANIPLASPGIPYVSNLTGSMITAAQATDPGYWADHMCSPVRFDAVLATLLEQPDLVLLELGPGQSLGAMARGHADCPPDRWRLVVPTLPAAGDPRGAAAALAEAAGRLWLAGVTVDWDAYQGDRPVAKVQLPGYPFQRQRYWIDAPAVPRALSAPALTGPAALDGTAAQAVPAGPAAHDPATSGPATPGSVFPGSVSPGTVSPGAVSAGPAAPGTVPFRPGHVQLLRQQWTETPAGPGPTVFGPVVSGSAVPGSAVPGPAPFGRALLLGGPDGVSAALAERLRAGGTTVTSMPPAADPAAVTALLAQEQPDLVIDLRVLDHAEPGDGRDVVLPFAALADALGSDGDRSPRVLLVTRGGQAVADGERPAPGPAAAGVLPVVANQEYLNLDCRTVDLDPRADAAEAAAALAAECASTTEDVLTAYRQGRRYTRVFGTAEPAAAPAAPVPPSPAAVVPSAVRPGGTYLITGGLGNVGLQVAEHLARAGAGRLILTSRAGLTADADDPRRAAVERLRLLGADVRTPAADVTDPAAMRAVLAAAVADGGELAGVIHAAADARPESFLPLRYLTADAVGAHFSAKVAGARVLAALLAELPASAAPDFCLLFSSTSAVLGGLAFGSYAAANAALTAIAQAAAPASTNTSPAPVQADAPASATTAPAQADAPPSATAPAQADAPPSANTSPTSAKAAAPAPANTSSTSAQAAASAPTPAGPSAPAAATPALTNLPADSSPFDTTSTSAAIRHTRWIAAGWDTWAGTLDKVDGGVGATMAAHAMSPAEAFDALERLLAAPEPAPLVVAAGLDDRMPRISFTPDTPAPQAAAESFPRPDLPEPYAPPLTATQRAIAAVWSAVLGVTPVGIRDNFFDLGGNSLVALQMLTLLRRQFGVTLPAVTLFEAPTVHTLAEILDSMGVDVAATGPGRAAGPATALAQVTDRPAPPAPARPDLDRQIAIVGMAGRFPGAASVDAFWRNLRDGVESISFFSPEELLAAGVEPALIRDPSYVPARPVLEDVAGFDAAFFGLSARTAALTDPQQRLFLEVCWEALEHSGYAAPEYRGRVGVYGGCNISTYLFRMPEEVFTGGEVSTYEIIMGNDKDALTTTASYLFNLHGPSVAVQTFCSTSLVATHLAVQSLRGGDCELALAGGVSIRVPDRVGHLFQPGGMESPDGHVRTFDAGAKGSMFGDGAAVVVLKRLSDAVRDGDHVWAVIRGSAMNNDGAEKVGYTAPSVRGQARVIADAMADAGVTGDDVSYIEAHGTATELGDPIEVAALTRAFGPVADSQYCPIGSAKTNVGHLDRAAGVAGLIKTSLALTHEVIPPSLHYTAPNPDIDFAASPFYVNAELSPWTTRGGRRPIAGINSLGMGGTNVHVVVERAPDQPAPPASGPDDGSARRYQVLPLSARSGAAADESCTRLAGHLTAGPGLRLADVAYTLQAGRKTFEHRRVVVTDSTAAAAATLAGTALAEAGPAGRPLQRVDAARGRGVAFLFTGVGEQYPGLVSELYRREPAFRAALDECAALLHPLLAGTVPAGTPSAGADLVGLLTRPRTVADSFAALLGRTTASSSSDGTHPDGTHPDGTHPDGTHPDGTGPSDGNGHLDSNGTDPRAAALRRTEVVQPAMFAVEYALAATLQSWGVRPQVMLGYSLGEYVAACLSGVLTLQDALALVARRAQLIATRPAGAMLAVPLPADELRARFPLSGLDVAAVNGPAATVVAGAPEAVAAYAGKLREAGIPSRELDTTHAFHSRMLADVGDELTAWIKDNVTLSAPVTPYISNLTGDYADADLVGDPGYWARHMCETVQFAAGARTLLADPELAIVEIGPGQSLGALLRAAGCPAERWPQLVPTLPAAADRRPDDAVLAECVARLWLLGVEFDWDAHHGRADGQPHPVSGRPGRIPLPTYPFQRQRHWFAGNGRALPAAMGGSPSQTLSCSTAEPPVIRPGDRTVPPGGRTAIPGDRAGTAGDRTGIAEDRTGTPGQPSLDTLDAIATLPVQPEEQWLYLPTWRQTAAPAPAAEGPGHWLVYTRDGLADETAAALAATVAPAGGSVQLVRPGPAYASGPDGYVIRPGSTEDTRTLLRELREAGAGLERAVYLWDLDESAADTSGVTALAALARAAGELGIETWSLDVAVAGTQPVYPGEVTSPHSAALAGPCRVIPLEYPQVTARLIDLASDPGPAGPRDLAAELRRPQADPTVALRRGRRWIPGFELMPAPELPPALTRPATPATTPAPANTPAPSTPATASASPATASPAATPAIPTTAPAAPVTPADLGPLREGGVYLITGGLGGIGLAMAEQLAAACQAKLVLLGRHGLPDQADWPALLDADYDDAANAVPHAGTAGPGETGAAARRTRERVARVAALLAAGTEVEIVTGDVGDSRDVRRACRLARQRFGALHGVLHVAGVPGQGLIQFKDAAGLDREMAAKVGGTLALAEALRFGQPDEARLDFLALFSSVTSTTGGGPGQAGYCAANAFLDAYAEQHDRPGRRVVSVNWGEWTWNAWDDGLSGYAGPLQEFFRANRARIGIGFEAGWRSLLRVLATGEPRVVVSTQDFPTMVRYSASFTVAAVNSRELAGTGGARHPRPDLVTPYTEPAGATEQAIAELWCEALHLEQVGAADSFFDLGGNSLLGVGLVAALRDAFTLAELPPHILYEAPTVAALGRIVDAAAAGTAPAPALADDGDRSSNQVRAQLRRSGLGASADRRRGQQQPVSDG